MRQAPKYLIIGDGRVAYHFTYYFHFLRLNFQKWSRSKNTVEELEKLCDEDTHILLLISDSAIENFIKENPCLLRAKYLIHFSGRLVLDNCYGAHPLMTFSNKRYKLSSYLKIPFILEEGGPPLSELLPGLKNQSFEIPKEMKAYYHALCVLSGNFTTILWQKFFKELKGQFNLKKKIAYPYLEQVTENLIVKADEALTGPLARNDQETIESNLEALKDDPYKKVYEAFVEIFNL